MYLYYAIGKSTTALVYIVILIHIYIYIYIYIYNFYQYSWHPSITVAKTKSARNFAERICVFNHNNNNNTNTIVAIVTSAR